ncbi:MAG: ABC transporter substrate-binding protein, partial [Marmoricola sp.]|nr:ABC transporter substrate-binding protein [Marmoricola sp.]
MHSVKHVLVRLARSARRGRHRGIVACLALVAATLAPALAAAPAAHGADKVTFTVGFTDPVDSLNPFVGYDADSYELWDLMYDYMIGYSMKDLSPVPALATKWETAADGKTWTFHIRSGVKWNDGVPLTAADIAYTYNRVLHGTTEAGNWGNYLNNVATVTAPDAQTVVLTLKKPNAVLPLLPIPIVPEHVWKNISEKQIKDFPNTPKNGQPVVGSGPFNMVQGTTGGSTYVMTANKSYWGGTPHVDELDFKLYKAQDPAVQALIKGEIDYVNDITPLQVRALKNRPGITAHNGISPAFEEIGFNTGSIDTKTGKPMGNPNPAVLDPKFRYALGFAVDRDRLVKSAYQGAALPGSTIIHPAYKRWTWTPSKDEEQTFDLTKAGQLLDAAGYKKGADGKRTMPNGKPIGTLRLYARATDQRSVDTLNFFQEWLKALGIDAKVTAMDESKLGDDITAGDYDVFQWDWFVEPDPDGILDDFTCGQRGGLSDSWYCDKQYDAMYQQQNQSTDLSAREAVVKKMVQQLYLQAPYIVTAYPTTGEAFRSDKFACFQPQPTPGGVWLVQYGTKNYTQLRPAKGAGSCDGIPDAAGAAKTVSAS